MRLKQIAETFLKEVTSGNIDSAYEKYVHPEFTHHNSYFRGDRTSLLQAMKESAVQFPNKTYRTCRMLEDGELVAVHGKVTLAEDSQWSVIHIFRFEKDSIIELWEASQQVLKDSPNQNGLF